MRLLVLPRYTRKGPSSRLRHYQFLDHLKAAGFTADIEPLLPDGYLDALYLGQPWPLWRTLAAIARRLRILMTAGHYDLIWIEKEVFPFLPALAERAIAWLGIRVVVDYDDAWHLRYRNHPFFLVRQFLGRKIEAVMRQATLVTAGNPFLIDAARSSGAQWIEGLPTVLDVDHYRVAAHQPKRCVQIVWIGSSLNSRYLLPIAEALREVCKDGRAELVVIGGHSVQLPNVPIRFEPWSEASEADLLAAADIGIMPLNDSEWERGKCAFKILQYMAAGLPVVASPVGVNGSIVTPDVGFCAVTPAEWTQTLRRLIDDAKLRGRMGHAGRNKVERDFSLATWGPRVASLLTKAARQRMQRVTSGSRR